MKTATINLYFQRDYLKCLLLLLFAVFLCTPNFAQDVEAITTNSDILETFASDYLNDTHFKEDWEFGVKVDDQKWTISVQFNKDGENSFSISDGFPKEPSFYFNTTRWALLELYEGKMNALTGAVKAFSTDYAPFDMEAMEGYQPGEDFVAKVVPFMFHFWTKGTPEIIPFGPEYSRNTHGAQATIFFYQPGLRSGWGILYPGQHANEHPKSKSNSFPSLLIFTKGKAVARLNGKDQEIKEGQAIFIPSGMEHEFLNPFDLPAEFILLMFGEGA